MDRTDTPEPAGAPAEAPPRAATPRKGSQWKVSPVLLLVLLAALLYRVVTSVTDRSGDDGGLIKWTEASQAPGIARASGKPILYDFTAAWCGPCKVLDRLGWADEKIAALVNEFYVPARVVDRAREDGRNPAWIDELERRYRVSAFPTLVVASADGREIAIAQGFGGKARLVEFLEGSRKQGPIRSP